MASRCNLLFAWLNCNVAFICAMSFVIRVLIRASSWCDNASENPGLLGLYVFMSSVCLLWCALDSYDFANDVCRVEVYCCEVVAALLVLAFFAFAVTPKDYSNWDEIKESCLLKSKSSCPETPKNVFSICPKTYKSDCCKPPVECGFQYQKTTSSWIAPSSGPIASNSDCKTWSNNQTKLCYDCNSCKARVVGVIKKDWMILAILLGSFLAMLVWMLLSESVVRIAGWDIPSFGYRGNNQAPV